MTISIENKDGTLFNNTFLSHQLANYLYTALINFQTDENETVKNRHTFLYENLCDHEKECIGMIETACEMIFFDGEDQ